MSTNKLLKMCSDLDFSIEDAENLFKQVNINKPFYDKYGFLTTFLNEAIDEENLKMVEVLLKNGADPNLIFDGVAVLWDLQYTAYPDEEFSLSKIADNSDENRLKIAQILLNYGANPNIVIDKESLFSYVHYVVFNDEDTQRQSAYRTRFFILLIAYGGCEKWCKPKIIKKFDKSKMSSYHLNGFKILDENDEVIAEI